MRLSVTPHIRLFDDAQLERILQDALRLLRQVAFRVQGTDELNDLLRTYGCEVDGETVRFPEAVIDKARALYRKAENHCPLTDAQKREIESVVREADALAGSGSGVRP